MVQSWYNNDGLQLFYGVDKTTTEAAGEYRTNGPLREIEVRIDLTSLATGSQTILSNTVFFPKMRIEEVVLEVQTAATSGGSATLDVGLISTDRSTEIDYDGFIAAEVLTAINTAGKRITYVNGTSKAGALIGTTTATVGHLVAKAGTAVFTAGVVYVRIKYRPN